jgi:dihydrodipicolinate synthase/N-acetylneuraminate lyase
MSIQKKYKGVVIPAVTPLKEDLSLDKEAVENIMLIFRSNKVIPFILGTTGESASFSHKFKLDLIQTAGKIKRPDMELYTGISSNCLEESIDLAHAGFDAGANVVVATLPSYYALSTRQMKKYFGQLADKVPGPLMIYNIPATTHMSIPLEVIDALSHHENIVGVKDSERSDERLKASLALWSQREDFSYFLGWAARSAEALMNGADGIVPSTGNFEPKLYNDLYDAAAAGDAARAMACQEWSDKKGNAYQQGRLLGESLAALKLIMQQNNFCKKYVMPPLQQLTPEEEQKVLEAYREACNNQIN